MTEISTYYQNCICCNSFNSELIGSGHDFEYDSCINSFKFHKCLNCGHIYLKNIPNRKELKIIYPIEYGNYSSSRINSFAFKVKSFLDSLSLRRIKKFTGKVSGLLDVGCADGLTLDCSKRVFKDVEIIEGLEISENAAKKTKEKGYKVLLGSIDEINLELNKYNIVILQQVIEHVYDPINVIKKISKSLKPGGLMMIETPTNECLDLQLFKKRYWGGYHIPRHFNIFSALGLERIASSFDLNLISVRYKPQPVHWIWSIHHIMKDLNFPKKLIGFFNMKNVFLLIVFTALEILQGLFTKRKSNMELVFKKKSY